MVNNGGGIQCEIKNYPLGKYDTPKKALFEDSQLKMYHNELEESSKTGLKSFEDTLKEEYEDQLEEEGEVKETYFY